MLGIVLTPYGQIPGAPPWEIGYSYGGNGTYLCPDDDALYQTQGEMGYYHDSQLGASATEYPFPTNVVAKTPPPQPVKTRMGWLAKRRAMRVAKALQGVGLGRGIPTDDELYATYGYVPQINGFVTFKEGTQPGTWIPPNGWNPAGAYGPQFAPFAPVLQTQAGTSGLGDTVDTGSQPVTPSVAQLLADIETHNRRLFMLSIVSTAAIAISALVTTIRNAKLIRQEKRILDEEERLIAEG